MSENRLRLSVLLTFGFVLLEAGTGFRSHSLALISDAGHNFTDGLALVLSWYALRVARRPATSGKTYGYHRVGILTALFNALTLLGISVFILREAVGLLLHPQAVAAAPMIAIALIAVAMNAAIALGLRTQAAHDLNMRSAYLHMLGDALSGVGVIAAGIVIHFTGWTLADPLVSVLIALFIARSSWGILTETVNILLENAPRGLDVEALAGAMRRVPGVRAVHDLHVWTIAEGMNALSCHPARRPAHDARCRPRCTGRKGDAGGGLCRAALHHRDRVQRLRSAGIVLRGPEVPRGNVRAGYEFTALTLQSSGLTPSARFCPAYARAGFAPAL